MKAEGFSKSQLPVSARGPKDNVKIISALARHTVIGIHAGAVKDLGRLYALSCHVSPDNILTPGSVPPHSSGLFSSPARLSA